MNSSICPTGFVRPNQHDERTYWASKLCSPSCQSPIFTRTHWNIIYNLDTACSWIGLPLVTILLITWIIDKQRRKQYIIISLGIYCFIMTFWFCIMSTLPFEDKYCATNTVPLDESDGVTLCAMESYITVYSGVGMACTCLISSIDLWLKIVRNYRDTSQYKSYFMTFIIVIPIIFTIVAGRGHYGLLIVRCFPKPPYNMIAFYYPAIAIIVLAASFMLSVCYTIMRKVLKVRTSRIADTSVEAARATLTKLSTLQRPIMFLITYFVLYLSIFLTNKNVNVNQLVRRFASCVFKHYDGISDASWIHFCGDSPYFTDMPSYYWVQVCTFGNSIFVGLVFLPGKGVLVIWIKTLRDVVSCCERILGWAPGVLSIRQLSGRFLLQRNDDYTDEDCRNQIVEEPRNIEHPNNHTEQPCRLESNRSLVDSVNLEPNNPSTNHDQLSYKE